MNKFSVIITAGGTSSRYGNNNKLLEKITDKTVIEETVYKFTGISSINQIIIPVNPINVAFGKQSLIILAVPITLFATCSPFSFVSNRIRSVKPY